MSNIPLELPGNLREFIADDLEHLRELEASAAAHPAPPDEELPPPIAQVDVIIGDDDGAAENLD